MSRSFSGYKDELVWAAIWLYKATGEEEYKTKAQSLYDQFGLGTGWFSWDDKSVGVHVLMAEAFPQEQKYKNAVARSGHYLNFFRFLFVKNH